MKRVLLATPVRDSLTLPYVSGLVDSLRCHTLGAAIIPTTCSSGNIAVARNDLVKHAWMLACDEIVFVDADVEWDAGHLKRLLSHDVPIVGGTYAKRQAGEPKWAHTLGTHNLSPDAVTGLLAAESLPAGFLRVKMSVFGELYERYPGRRYDHGQGPRCEYFPSGLMEKTGHRTPAEAKLDAIFGILHEMDDVGYAETYNRIHRVIRAQDPAVICTEDAGFSRLARGAGYTLWLDPTLVLGHHGSARFPLTETPLPTFP